MNISTPPEYLATRPLPLNMISSPSIEHLQKFRSACIAIHVCIYLTVSNKAKSHPSLSVQFTCSFTSSGEIETLTEVFTGPPNSPPLDIENAPVPSFLSLDNTGLTTRFRKLKEIVKKKDSAELSNFGGTTGIVRFLKTDMENGIHENELRKRRQTFGSNTNKKPNLKRLIWLVFESFMGYLCRILTVCALLSMVFRTITYGARDGWSHGGSTIIGLFLSRMVFLAILCFRTERKLYKLHSSCVKIDAVRNGTRKTVWISDIVVGDVIYLKPGDQVPTDGICIDGNSLQVDESSVTGKTDHVDVNSVHNPFLLHGSKVVSGSSKMIVTSVGMYTDWGDKTPLQVRLNELTTSLKKVGVHIVLLLFTVQLTCYHGKTENEDNRSAIKMLHTVNSVLEIIFKSVSTLLLVNDDLELTFDLALVNSLKRMKTLQVEFQNHVSCETMGSVTVICTSKADILTFHEIKSLKVAGVDIKMITSENVNTAKRIATDCGILDVSQHGTIGKVIEGAEFTCYTPKERLQKVDDICVLANSSSQHKLLMIQYLKQKGHDVAVTAEGTNDPSALKEADVALFMGREGSEVANENSDIFIRSDDFSSVSTVINRGRCFYNNVQKYLQYKLTITISSLVITLIAAVSGKDLHPTIIQSLFADLIEKLVTAVVSVRPLEDLMHSPHVRQTEPLITNVMWRNILAQAIYQIVVQSTLLYVGFIHDDNIREALLFNTYLLCRVFNLFNSMMLDEKDAFGWIHKNARLLGVSVIIIILQFVMVQVLGPITGTVRLSLAQWGICFAIAGVTLPIGLIMKVVPVTKEPFLCYLRDSYTHVIHFL